MGHKLLHVRLAIPTETRATCYFLFFFLGSTYFSCPARQTRQAIRRRESEKDNNRQDKQAGRRIDSSGTQERERNREQKQGSNPDRLGGLRQPYVGGLTWADDFRLSQYLLAICLHTGTRKPNFSTAMRHQPSYQKTRSKFTLTTQSS